MIWCCQSSFINEISMVGCHIFNKIDQYLQEIFGCKKVCSGCHVVTIGDFYQMKPAKGTYIFKNQDSGYSALATNTWTDHFKIFALVEIMRQHDEKEFCEVLNRLRKAVCTQVDHDLFQSCIVDKNSAKYVDSLWNSTLVVVVDKLSSTTVDFIRSEGELKN